MEKFSGGGNIITEPTVYASYSVGEEVIVGGEKFFVLKNSNENESNVTLLAKYCLNKAGTAQDKNLTSDSSGSGRQFSSTNYWSSDYTSNMNLNTYTMPSSETTSNNSIKVAQAYGTAKGGIGRLMTYQEATALECTTLTGSCPDWISGKGDSYISSEATASGYLRYWLGSANGSSDLWSVYGGNGYLVDFNYTNSYRGVRPVIEISKDKVTKIN